MAHQALFGDIRSGLEGTFTYKVTSGNIGINLGIPAPMAYFPFAGAKDSFFGTLHGQGTDAVQFFTDSKVVITRW